MSSPPAICFRLSAIRASIVASGGSVQGTIDGLNRILDLAVPSKSLALGGTYVIPGHGRIS